MISEPEEEELPKTAKYALEEMDAFLGDLLVAKFKTGEDEMTPELHARFEKAVKGLETELDDLKKIIGEMEKTISAAESGEKKARGKKEKPAAETPPAGEPKPHAEGGALLVKDVTIEMLREMATRYAEVFGMEKLLGLNKKHGSAKLSGIDPKMYGVVYGEMQSDLAAAEAIKKQGGTVEKVNGDPAKLQEELNKAPSTPPLTIEKVREHAAAFLSKSGEPAFKAVLKAFGAEKLSGVPAEKWPAFLEAIDG